MRLHFKYLLDPSGDGKSAMKAVDLATENAIRSAEAFSLSKVRSGRRVKKYIFLKSREGQVAFSKL